MPESKSPSLARDLTARDGALLTIGSIVGTGIFLTTGYMAAALPHPGLIMLAWVAGGLLTIAGALTYGELGAMFPQAGGLYVFLKEAYGPLWGFLYGWTAFLVIMTGGIAAVAAAVGNVLGGFIPYFASSHRIAAVPIGPWTWTLSGAQIASVLAILLLTAVNHRGLKAGSGIQNVLTWIKIGSILGLAIFGLSRSAPAMPHYFAAIPGHLAGTALISAFGVAMISALWTFDGWYGLTFSAGEMKNPGRDLPWGLLVGTCVVTGLYLLVNVLYLRALPIAQMAGVEKVGEASATALFGAVGGKLLGVAVFISCFGALASTILYSSRIYQPIAADGLFFRRLAAIDPKTQVPAASLWAQTGWSIVLALSGTFEQLYTYVIFASILFQIGVGAAVFVLRAKRPDLPRPYRTWGYPVVPALFLLASLALVATTLAEKPVESLWGLGLVALGLPAYAIWKRRAKG
ncbi:MAG: amino acid permease [Acidobacteriota bacterium]